MANDVSSAGDAAAAVQRFTALLEFMAHASPHPPRLSVGALARRQLHWWSARIPDECETGSCDLPRWSPTPPSSAPSPQRNSSDLIDASKIRSTGRNPELLLAKMLFPMFVLDFFIPRSSPWTLNHQHPPLAESLRRVLAAALAIYPPHPRCKRTAEVSLPTILGNLPYIDSQTTGDRTVAWGFILTRGIPSSSHLAFSQPHTVAVFLCNLPLLALFPHAALSNLSALHKIPPGPSLHPP